ncbi:MAG: NfeD family protein [Campylobacter sp.]|nr:NfeD family protein [Campylobacter sp.]
MNSALLFVIVGVVFMIAEVLMLDFTFLLLGLGFVASGIVGFVLPISWEILAILAFVFSAVFLLLFKQKLKNKFLKPKENLQDNFLDESGMGVIQNGMVYYKSTFWKSDEINGLSEGDKVKVLGVKNGQIVLNLQSDNSDLPKNSNQI